VVVVVVVDVLLGVSTAATPFLDGSASPAVATVATASANTMFHGVALAPR